MVNNGACVFPLCSIKGVVKNYKNNFLFKLRFIIHMFIIFYMLRLCLN